MEMWDQNVLMLIFSGLLSFGLLPSSSLPLLHHHFPNISECSYQHFSNFEAREMAEALSALLNNTGHALCPAVTILKPVRLSEYIMGRHQLFI